jgi:TetR/AcrR family transcriptional repressor of mexJK operon
LRRQAAKPLFQLQSIRPRDLLSISDAMVAATQFNWLVMGEPVNQAMFRADYVLSRAERARHIEQAVRVFIAAYRI